MSTRPHAAVLALLAALAAAPLAAPAQDLPVTTASAPLGRPVATPEPRILRADQPNRDPAAPDPVTGDPSLVHGWAAGLNVDGIDLSGVARLRIPTSQGIFLCTGSLIGPHTLITAAHCVTDDATGAIIVDPGGLTARFYGPTSAVGPTGFVDYHSAFIQVLPTWHGFSDPSVIGGDDIAIVQLFEAAQPWMEQYDFFFDNPFFQPTTHVGYGVAGNGVQGEIVLDGRRRWGQNRVDLLTIDGVLFTDFDDGTHANDAWCWADDYTPGSPFCDTGRGAFESALGGGDSGGPLFIDGRIAGIASFFTFFCDPDVLAATGQCVPASPPVANPAVPDGFGSLNGFAWAPFNEDFIAEQLAIGARIPEPATVVLVAGGLALIAVVARRRARR